MKETDIKEQNNKILAMKGMRHAYMRVKTMTAEQNSLLQANKEAWEQAVDVSGEELAKKVKVALLQDKLAIQELDLAIKNLNEVNLTKIPWGIISNKWQDIIQNVSTLFGDDETNIIKLAEGKLPWDLDNKMAGIPLLGKGEYWGKPISTDVSAAILAINFTLTGTNVNNICFNSSIAQVFPIPRDFKLPANFRFNYDDGIIKAIGVVHSGYSFGGDRPAFFYQKNNNNCSILKNIFSQKIYQPYDCSSFVAAIVGDARRMTTDDWLCIHRSQKGGFVPKSWKLEGEDKLQYQSISPENAEIGDIICRRFFNNSSPKDKSLGISGHMGIMINKISNHGDVMTIGANRGAAGEGVGIEKFTINNTDNNEVFFLSLSQQNFSNKYPVKLYDMANEFSGQYEALTEVFDKLLGEGVY